VTLPTSSTSGTSPNKKSLIEQMKDRFGGEDATKRIADRIRTEGIVQAGDNIENIAQKSQKPRPRRWKT